MVNSSSRGQSSICLPHVCLLALDSSSSEAPPAPPNPFTQHWQMSSVLMDRPLAEMTYSIVHLKCLFRAVVQLHFPLYWWLCMFLITYTEQPNCGKASKKWEVMQQNLQPQKQVVTEGESEWQLPYIPYNILLYHYLYCVSILEVPCTNREIRSIR